MNVTEIIDQVLERTDNIKGSPADYADRRQRLLEYLRETADEVWWLRDWPWKLLRGTVVVPGGQSFVEVPPDFASFGNSGGVFQDLGSGGDGYKLDLVTESEILDQRERDFRTNTPHQFALFGQDAASYLTLIQLPPNDIDVPLSLWYQPNPPTLDEGANVDNIKRIPVKYHQRVIVEGVRMRSRESKADDRWKNSAAKFESGKTWMMAEEARYQGRSRALPSFFGERLR